MTMINCNTQHTFGITNDSKGVLANFAEQQTFCNATQYNRFAVYSPSRGSRRARDGKQRKLFIYSFLPAPLNLNPWGSFNHPTAGACFHSLCLAESSLNCALIVLHLSFWFKYTALSTQLAMRWKMSVSFEHNKYTKTISFNSHPHTHFFPECGQSSVIY